MSESKNTGPALAHESYIAVALQPKVYGCRNRDDIMKNMTNQTRLIDDAFLHAPLAGGGPVKLIAIPEGSLQGFWDETSHMDQATYCKDIAMTLPGRETDMLAKKAQEYGVYIVAQAKVVDPDIMPGRYFNMGFIISPSGDIILKHTKNIIGVVEGSASPWDVWDNWKKKFGESLDAYYPVAKTEIGNLAVAICAETMFPETFRAFAAMGAEVIVKMTLTDPFIMDGHWESVNRTRAFDNVNYLVCPNHGQYYMNPDMDAQFVLTGGHSMIIDYMGRVMVKSNHVSVGCVPAEINVRALRRYRTTAPGSSILVQMRSSMWKQIYDIWPEYPKNLYMEKTYNHALDRHAMHLELLEKFYEAGIYTRPEQP
jgi:predicted amidohydrolase